MVLNKLLKKESGSVLIFVGMFLFVILAVMLLVYDMGRSQSFYSKNQGGVDAAALAAAEYITKIRILNPGIATDDTTYLEVALQAYKANVERDQEFARIKDEDFAVQLVNNVITITACLEVPTSISESLMGGKEQIVCNTASATLPTVSDIEVSFGIDASSSMLEEVAVAGEGTNTKLYWLQKSLKTVIESYANDYGDGDVVEDVYWAVVPYRGMVNLGDYSADIIDNDRSSSNKSSQKEAREDKHMSGEEEMKIKMMDYLSKVPLTERVNGSTDLINNSSPAEGGKFRAYWHHQEKYWFAFDDEGTNCSGKSECKMETAIEENDPCFLTGKEEEDDDDDDDDDDGDDR